MALFSLAARHHVRTPLRPAAEAIGTLTVYFSRPPGCHVDLLLICDSAIVAAIASIFLKTHPGFQTLLSDRVSDDFAS